MENFYKWLIVIYLVIGCKKCTLTAPLNVEYFTQRSKQVHGEFRQSVKGHYSGHGCTECAKQYTQSKQELLIIEMLMNLLPDEEILTSISPEWMERTKRSRYINTI